MADIAEVALFEQGVVANSARAVAPGPSRRPPGPGHQSYEATAGTNIGYESAAGWRSTGCQVLDDESYVSQWGCSRSSVISYAVAGSRGPRSSTKGLLVDGCVRRPHRPRCPGNRARGFCARDTSPRPTHCGRGEDPRQEDLVRPISTTGGLQNQGITFALGSAASPPTSQDATPAEAGVEDATFEVSSRVPSGRD